MTRLVGSILIFFFFFKLFFCDSSVTKLNLEMNNDKNNGKPFFKSLRNLAESCQSNVKV